MELEYAHLFFFSSRRRHTRLQGDWSSDVCSSDLPAEHNSAIRFQGQTRRLSRLHLTRRVGFIIKAMTWNTLWRPRTSERHRLPGQWFYLSSQRVWLLSCDMPGGEL